MYYAIASFLMASIKQGITTASKLPTGFLVEGVVIQSTGNSYHLKDVSSGASEKEQEGGTIHSDPRLNEKDVEVAILLLAKLLVSIQYPQGTLKKFILTSLKKKLAQA